MNGRIQSNEAGRGQTSLVLQATDAGAWVFVRRAARVAAYLDQSRDVEDEENILDGRDAGLIVLFRGLDRRLDKKDHGNLPTDEIDDLTVTTSFGSGAFFRKR